MSSSSESKLPPPERPDWATHGDVVALRADIQAMRDDMQAGLKRIEVAQAVHGTLLKVLSGVMGALLLAALSVVATYVSKHLP